MTEMTYNEKPESEDLTGVTILPASEQIGVTWSVQKPRLRLSTLRESQVSRVSTLKYTEIQGMDPESQNYKIKTHVRILAVGTRRGD